MGIVIEADLQKLRRLNILKKAVGKFEALKQCEAPTQCVRLYSITEADCGGVY